MSGVNISKSTDIMALGLRLSSLADSSIFGLDEYIENNRKPELNEKTLHLLKKGIQLCHELKEGIELNQSSVSIHNISEINAYKRLFSYDPTKEKVIDIFKINIEKIETILNKIIQKEKIPEEKITSIQDELEQISEFFLSSTFTVFEDVEHKTKRKNKKPPRF